MSVSERAMNGANVAEQVNAAFTDPAHTDLESQRRNLPKHSEEVLQWHARVLAGSPVRNRYVEVGSERRRVHLLEAGEGQPVVMIHGIGVSSGFFLPLLNELKEVRAIAADLPAQGLSDPIDLVQNRYRVTAVAWLDQLLDSLKLDSAAMLGHSAGGLWALWYALAHPDRISRLVLIGPPALPRTRCPLPYRLMATPGLGRLLSRFGTPSQKFVRWFASFMGESSTITHHPDLIDLFVVAGRDPIAAVGHRTEIHTLVSKFALLEPSGFRRNARVRQDELRRLTMPTLLLWGDHEPLGSVKVAQAVTDLITDASFKVLPGGHVPWLGHPRQTAEAIIDFLAKSGPSA